MSSAWSLVKGVEGWHFFNFDISRVEKSPFGSYDSPLMNTEKIKRYSLVEVALLAIFFIGLLTANLIVKIRNRIDLSDPISLPGSGLSVSLPDNQGWKHSGAWQYEDAENGMMLVSQFVAAPRSIKVVRWRFSFTTPDGSERDLLQQKADKMGAVVQRFDSAGSSCPMVYARMLMPQSTREEIYMGIMRLDGFRSIELLVNSKGVSDFQGETIFQTLVETITYRPDASIADGRALMDAFLKARPDQVTRGKVPREVFLIKDTAGRSLGYYYADHSLAVSQENQASRMTIRRYENNAFEIDSEIWLNSLEKKYRWKTKLNKLSIQASMAYEIFPDEKGGLRVTHNAEEVKSFSAGHFLLPEPLLIDLARVFLLSDYRSVIVDVLAFNGRLAPVRLVKVDTESKSNGSGSVNSIVRMDFLNYPNSHEKLLFDESQNLLGKFEQLPVGTERVWDVVTVETLQNIFEIDLKASTGAVARR